MPCEMRLVAALILCICMFAYCNARRSNAFVRRIKLSKTMKNRFVEEHNKFRQMAPSTNMRFMEWDEKLARRAQEHADRCTLQHSTPEQRKRMGENIWSHSFFNQSDVVDYWHRQVYDKECNCDHTYKKCCGHYTQVVWSTSYKLGCGVSECMRVSGLKDFYKVVVVCHYWLPGNWVMEKYINGRYVDVPLPAFKYRSNNQRACSECSISFDFCKQGLCSRSP